jgi:glutathione S-transferase
MLKRGLGITPAGAARSEAKLDDLFARMSERLADGRPYLCGDRFTVADLTFAALGAPVLQPDEHPFALPKTAIMSAAARMKMAAWRGSLAGEHALAMYATRGCP